MVEKIKDVYSHKYIFKNGCIVDIMVWGNRKLFSKYGAGKNVPWYAFFHPNKYNAEQLPDGTLKPIWQQDIGTIHFVKGDYGSGVVTHECSHACIQWLEVSGFNIKENDEDFCTELGLMVSGFWKWHYEVLFYVLIGSSLILVIRGDWQALPVAILSAAVALKERNVD